MGTTQRMASFITKAQFEDIPTPAVNLAKLCLLDAVGCAIYGTTRPLGKIFTGLVDELGGKPVARVLGTNIETNAVNAAMANGTLGHSEDFDDFTGGHQAVLLMPVVLAMGEEHRLSGKQALLSYIVGFDITLNVTPRDGRGSLRERLAQHVEHRHARLDRRRGEDDESRRNADAYGARHRRLAGRRLACQFRHDDEAFPPRQCLSGRRARSKDGIEGLRGEPGRHGASVRLRGCLRRRDDESCSRTAAPGANPWALMGSGKEVANGIAIKIWPCCGGTHGANTAITKLLKKTPFKAADVASVDIITTHEPSCMAPNLRWPQSGLQGKFSTWFTVASMIVDGGKLDLSSFTDEAAMRPAVQEMLKKVNITQDPEYAGRPHRAKGGGHYWDVTVTLKNGEKLHAPRSEATGGRGDTYGWETREAVFEKFKMLAGSVLKPSQIDAAMNEIMGWKKWRTCARSWICACRSGNRNSCQ
jgi:2-methylcitrate dehydratase PrpD